MLERQPNRPTESELKGAVLRMSSNDYWIEPSQEAGSHVTSAVVCLGFWVPRSLIRRTANGSTTRWYDQSWSDNDSALIERERSIEGINPDETYAQFVERKRQELLPKKD